MTDIAFGESHMHVILRSLQILNVALLLLPAAQGRAQQTDGPPQATTSPAPAAAIQVAPSKPLPDIVTMMHDVERNQRKAEAIEKDYICHSVEVQEQTDSSGHVKKTTISEYDHYWSEGVPVHRLVRKDGKDLSPSELAKQDDHIRKEVEKARERRAKSEAEGKPTNARGDEIITVSRLLELGRFSNPRRVELGGRETIAVDYDGDRSAKTRNRAEEVIRDLRGTVWVDENDEVMVRAEGYFANGFKIGAGLLINIQKGTCFQMQQTKINGEVWSPSHIEAYGAARALLFFNFSGNIRVDYSTYRKLRTTSVVLPGVTKVDGEQPPSVP
jgi:hypothetical protein